MSFEIIDFHTHPFIDARNNICTHTSLSGMGPENTLEVLRGLGISKFCGSVLRRGLSEGETNWDKVLSCNNEALKLRDFYKGAYLPGIHVHPDYVDGSIAEMRRAAGLGVKLVGELEPSYFGWKNYESEGFSAIMDEAGRLGMVVDLHLYTLGNDDLDQLAARHKDVIIVGAHPKEYDTLMRHIERVKKNDNYYIDLAGDGITRYGALRRLIDSVGADRLLFGTDFPSRNPGMWLGAILNDPLITDTEREKILSLNAKRVLGLS